jgi:hypothetical protein
VDILNEHGGGKLRHMMLLLFKSRIFTKRGTAFDTVGKIYSFDCITVHVAGNRDYDLSAFRVAVNGSFLFF